MDAPPPAAPVDDPGTAIALAVAAAAAAAPEAEPGGGIAGAPEAEAAAAPEAPGGAAAAAAAAAVAAAVMPSEDETIEGGLARIEPWLVDCLFGAARPACSSRTSANMCSPEVRVQGLAGQKH